jgi:branched-chain amino acid transport system permease protein
LSYLLDQLINGITLGSVYGLIALGYTMVYGIIGMINFAHGEIYMIGAFVGLIAILVLMSFGITALPVVLLLALIATIFFTSIYGWSVERVAYRPLRGSSRLAPLISAIGMSVLLQNYVQLAQGARVKPLRPMIEGGLHIPLGDGQSARLAYVQILIVTTTLVMMTIFTFIVQRTNFGRTQRACEQDRTMAGLLGVNVDRVISMTFAIGASMAAVAGLLVVLYYGSIDFFIGFLAGLKAFTAAVLGGVGSLPGAMLGGLLIGLIEALYSAYFDIEYKDAAVFGVLILVLLFRPQGLLGRAEIEKV